MQAKGIYVAITLLFLLGAATTRMANTSTDGVAYGDPVEIKAELPKSPVVGALLSKPPKQALGGRQVWHGRTSHEKVGALFKAFKTRPDVTTTYYTKGGYASDVVTGFDVEDWRIVRVVIYFPGRPDSRCKEVAEQ
jgi:hypothetical protein